MSGVFEGFSSKSARQMKRERLFAFARDRGRAAAAEARADDALAWLIVSASNVEDHATRLGLDVDDAREAKVGMVRVFVIESGFGVAKALKGGV